MCKLVHRLNKRPSAMVFRLATDSAELLINHSSVYHLTLNLATVADIQIAVEIMEKRNGFSLQVKDLLISEFSNFSFFHPSPLSLFFFSHLIENHFLEYN